MNNNSSKAGSLYIVFKYVAIGTGILGIGILIAALGFIITSR